MRLPGLQIYSVKEANIKPIVTAAAEDAHSALFPSQMLIKDGEIVGYLAINTIPTATVWFHSQKMLPRDTFQAAQFIENYVAGQGGGAVMIPVPENSPLCKYMNPSGYMEANGNHRLFLKNLL
jgi:hypothetical protein